MKCRWSKENLSAYIDGELNIITGWIIKRHAKFCPECQKELNELQKISKLSKLLLIKEPEFDFYEQVREKLQQVKIAQQEKPEIAAERKSIERMWTFLPQSGKAALLVGVAALLFFLVIYPQIFPAPSLSIEQFEEEYLRSRETLPWVESPALSATLMSAERG
ncbi:zf-HC2 domain-containing protein [Candidatus Aerophobetes bacterium]|nr:zf-HC2 domain-containing protein [Candidatus Aerophobetes bacterium]